MGENSYFKYNQETNGGKLCITEDVFEGVDIEIDPAFLFLASLWDFLEARSFIFVSCALILYYALVIFSPSLWTIL